MHTATAAAFVRSEYQKPRVLAAPLAGLAALATIAGAGAGHAQSLDQWYVAGAVTGSALNRPHQTIANAPTPGATLQVTNAVDFGWGGQVALGHRFGRLRLEGEVGHTENDSKAYTATAPISITLPQQGRNSVTRYMANAYYDFPKVGFPGGGLPVDVYIGAGVGAADGRVSTFAAPARAPAAPPSLLMDFEQTVFAYQLMAGLSHPIGPHLAITAQYRWFDAGTIKGHDARGERATRDIAGHNFDLGLRYAF